MDYLGEWGGGGPGHSWAQISFVLDPQISNAELWNMDSAPYPGGQLHRYESTGSGSGTLNMKKVY
jgi:hypothetical protein